MRAPTGKGILDAVRFYLTHWHTTTASITFSALAEQIRTETNRRLEANEIGSRQSASLIQGLRKLEGHFGSRIVSDISINEVREWLTGLPIAARSKTNNLKIGRQVFGFAVEHGYTNVNPFKAIKPFQARVTEENEKVHVLTADETSRLLNAADPSVVPYLALAFFTGIRRATLERLDWSDIKLDESRVIVPGHKGKNQKRYQVTLSENLLEWIRPFVKEAGSLLVTNRNGKADAIATRKLIIKASHQADVVLPNNAARHTFISNHVAFHCDLGLAALEANNSVAVIKETYLDVVSKSEATKFWNIGPKA